MTTMRLWKRCITGTVCYKVWLNSSFTNWSYGIIYSERDSILEMSWHELVVFE